jgi:hypothetical protein
MSVMSKSRPPGRPRKTEQPAPDAKVPILYLRLPAELEAALQQFIAAQRIKPDRTAVGLTALEELLAKEGFWPPGSPAQ